MNTIGSSLVLYIKGHTHHSVVAMEDSVVIDTQEYKWAKVSELASINVTTLFVDFTKDLQKYFDKGLSMLKEEARKIRERKEILKERNGNGNHYMQQGERTENVRITEKQSKIKDTLNIVFIPTSIFTDQNNQEAINIHLITSQLDSLHKLLYFTKRQSSFITATFSLILPIGGKEIHVRGDIWENMFLNLFKAHIKMDTDTTFIYKLVRVSDNGFLDENNENNSEAFDRTRCDCNNLILDEITSKKFGNQSKMTKDGRIEQHIVLLNYTCCYNKLHMDNSLFNTTKASKKSNITVGHYLSFTSHYRWGRRAPTNSMYYMADWLMTAHKYTPDNSNIIIFHDHLNDVFQSRLSTYYPRVKFQRVHSLNRRILHDQRFYMTYNYLLLHPEVQYIVITDIRDTIFMNDPFSRMSTIGRNYFFIDNDSPFRFSVSDLPWLGQMTRLCYPSPISDESMYMYGCYDNGFMGGTRSIMLGALIRILMLLDSADLWSVCDQVTSNLIVHEYMYDIVYAGYPLTAGFMTGMNGPYGIAVKHKPYEYINEH